jgi:hypothetical protein
LRAPPPPSAKKKFFKKGNMANQYMRVRLEDIEEQAETINTSILEMIDIVFQQGCQHKRSIFMFFYEVPGMIKINEKNDSGCRQQKNIDFRYQQSYVHL